MAGTGSRSLARPRPFQLELPPDPVEVVGRPAVQRAARGHVLEPLQQVDDLPPPQPANAPRRGACGWRARAAGGRASRGNADRRARGRRRPRAPAAPPAPAPSRTSAGAAAARSWSARWSRAPSRGSARDCRRSPRARRVRASLVPARSSRTARACLRSTRSRPRARPSPLASSQPSASVGSRADLRLGLPGSRGSRRARRCRTPSGRTPADRRRRSPPPEVRERRPDAARGDGRRCRACGRTSFASSSGNLRWWRRCSRRKCRRTSSFDSIG